MVSLSNHFNPSKVIRPEHVTAIVTGDYPRLREIGEAYGDEATQAIVFGIVTNIIENAGGKEMLTPMQVSSLAATIYAEHPWMKITELLLFAQRFKGGHYGRFFGAQDPTVITEALLKFREELNGIYEKEEKRKAEERLEKELRNPRLMTYEEYQESERVIKQIEAEYYMETRWNRE